MLCLSACLLSIACPSRRSASGPDKAAGLRSRIDLISGLLDQRGLAARVFEDLSGALPDSAWLADIAFDGTVVHAKGYAPSNTVVADYVSRLGGGSSLADVNLLSSVQRRIRNRDFQEFAVQAAVKVARGGEPSVSGAGATLVWFTYKDSWSRPLIRIVYCPLGSRFS